LAIRFVETLGFARYATWRLALAALAKVQSDKQRLARAIHQGMWLQMIAVGLPLAAFALVGPWFCGTMLGKSWGLTFAIFPFLALATLVNAGMNLHVSALLALRQNSQVTACCVVLVGIFAGAALGLVPRLGVAGYGWAELAAFPGYLLVHGYALRAVGTINYRPAAVWFLAIALSLFVGQWYAWAYLGWLPLVARRATWLECRQLWHTTVRPLTSGTRKSTDPETPAAP
jgi:PST family polysaccharide transporter